MSVASGVMHDQELQWMRAVRNGDRRAFENLYHHFKNPIAGFLHRQGCPPSHVEDLLQEIFVRVWKGARNFRAESKASTYLFRIAYNVWVSEGRRRSFPSTPLPSDAAGTRPAAPASMELSEEIAHALSQLNEGERSVFLLSELHGFRYSEIAEILDIPVGTIKSRMSSAIQKLKVILSRYLEESGP